MLSSSHQRAFLLKGLTSSKCKCLFKPKKRSRCICTKWYPQVEDFCPRAFTLPRWPLRLFSENCLITWILSNRIRLPVLSGQTLHSTGGISPCTFHLFLMAGPSGTRPCGYLASAISSDIALSSSEGSQDGEGKHLKVKANDSLSTFLWVESAIVRAQNILSGHDSSKASRD